MEIEAPRGSHGNSSSSSPEFEFCMHPSLHHQPDLLTADELFADGVLLPLHLLSLSPPCTKPKPTNPQPETKPDPQRQPECSNPPSSSKRWRDLFKKKDRKASAASNSGRGGRGGAELNINIWPFYRSRSAGSCRKQAAVAAMRKSSSAPCSRSSSRRWAASPARAGAGVHVGRAGPVWHSPRRHVRRGGVGGGAGGGGVRGLNLNGNSCSEDGTQQVSCRGDVEEGGVTRGERNIGVNGGLFKIRALFAKKVY